MVILQAAYLQESLTFKGRFLTCTCGFLWFHPGLGHRACWEQEGAGSLPVQHTLPGWALSSHLVLVTEPLTSSLLSEVPVFSPVSEFCPASSDAFPSQESGDCLHALWLVLLCLRHRPVAPHSRFSVSFCGVGTLTMAFVVGRCITGVRFGLSLRCSDPSYGKRVNFVKTHNLPSARVRTDWDATGITN